MTGYETKVREKSFTAGAFAAEADRDKGSNTIAALTDAVPLKIERAIGWEWYFVALNASGAEVTNVTIDAQWWKQFSQWPVRVAKETAAVPRQLYPMERIVGDLCPTITVLAGAGAASVTKIQIFALGKEGL